MRPKQPAAKPEEDLFRARLQNLVDSPHALVRLAGPIDWSQFEVEFGALYTDNGRLGMPTRLMVGLQLLKHMDGSSDEAVCTRYLDSPYAQLFCGKTYFQHALPLDRSSLTRWRQRIGPGRLEVLLAETLAAARRGGAVEEKHQRRVTIDTTVQPKAVTHQTDSKLLHRGIEMLARLARRHRIRLRQSYLRVARRARREAAKLIHSGRPRQAERQVRQLRTRARAPAPRHRLKDCRQGCHSGRPRRAAWAHRPLAAAAARRPWAGQALLAARAGGRVHRQGQGPSPLRVRREGLACHHQRRRVRRTVRPGARALPGNPYDGHTLAAQIVQTERLTGIEIERAYVDRGYRGHNADKSRVFISGQKRAITPTIRRERRLRSAIEPVIGHLKSDGHLGRNFLRGTESDATNVILAAVGYNPRLLLAWILTCLLSLLRSSQQTRQGRQLQPSTA